MKNISVFVSSTFNDMQSERDLIRDSIAPELQNIVRKYGCNLDFVDLRWGINTKDMSETEANRKILQTCFDEIHNSRPFFVAFIAERYGWVPDGEDVKEAFRNDNQQLTDEDLEKSITELEIDCALKSFPNPEHCLFFFRKPIDYGNDKAAENSFVSRGKDRRKLELLKERILRLYPQNVTEYDGVWNEKTQRIEGLEELETLLGQRVGKTLEEELSKDKTPSDPTEECVNFTESLVSAYNASFAGREREIEEIFRFLHGSDSRLATLVGDSGCGKSALLSRVTVLAEKEGYAVLPFFAGCHEYAQSAENLMTAIAYEACKISDTNCTDGDRASRYYRAVNSLALKRKTLLVIDAVNQLTPSASEEKMVWLNTFALHPSVKILLSATSDYGKMKQLVARNSEIINVNYFSDEDAASVSEKFFRSNHRQINDALLSAIVNKQDNACNNPVYLITLLTRLNNIGKDDFAAIHRREKELNETPIDAIFNYLIAEVEAAPADFSLLLNDFLQSIAARLGDICYVFTAAISGSRRGINERFLEKICNGLGYTYRTADFSYYRKLLGAHVTQRENGAWDISHLLVKQLFNKCVPEQLARSVTEKIAECLEEEESDFKQTEYAYYLRLTDKLVRFAPYLTTHRNDAVVSSLVTQINEDGNLSATARLFEDEQNLFSVCKFVSDTVAENRYSAATAEKLTQLALNAVYRNDGYQSDPAAIAVIADLYCALGRTAMYGGYNSAAKDYLLMAVGLQKKLNTDCAGNYRLLAEISRKTGNIVAEARYNLLYKKNMDPASSAEQIFNLLYEKAMGCTEYVTRKRAAGRLLDKMRKLLSETPDAMHCAKLLTVCARANIPLSPRERQICEEFATTQPDGYEKAYVLYTLAFACPTDNVIRAEEAYRIAKELLAATADADALKLSADIAELLCALYKEERLVAQMKTERLECLAQLNALSPRYDALTEYMLSAPKNTPAYRDACKRWHEAARGVIKKEYLIADKVMALITICVCAVFLVLMPVFALFHGINYILDDLSNSPMKIFTTFYVNALFESFYNVTFCFGMYALIQVVRPQTDYASRKRWGIRCAAYFGAAGLLVLLFSVVYKYLDEELFSLPPFVGYELPVVLLLSSELAILMLGMQEVLNLCMREAYLYPAVRSRRRFVTEYRARAGEFAVNVLLLILFSTAYLLLCNGQIYGSQKINDWTSDVVMALPKMIFVICAATLMAFMTVRFTRLTVLYVKLGRKGGERK